MPKLTKMAVTTTVGTGTKAYVFRSYAPTYAQVNAVVGIDPATEAQQALPLSRIEDLIAANILQVMACQVGTTPATRQTYKILCKNELVEAAEAALIGKTVGKGAVVSVSANLSAENYL
ncbi:hypothetical protein QUB05_21000 [Microcoleus sp. F10-C6]|uniref:hypothetical protein n=1 Tax=unclassified Microcoleus TaxID=2642155 RepID=UPI002FD6A31E